MSPTHEKIDVARIYDSRDVAHDPGTLRVLVDRLWPRGVSKDDAAIDLWPKDALPSTELRKTWHADPDGHEPSHFEAFKAAYRDELAHEPAASALSELAQAVQKSDHVLLLTAAKDPSISHVPVLLEALEHGES